MFKDKASAIRYLLFALVSIALVAGFGFLYSVRPIATLKLDATEVEVRVLLSDLKTPWDMSWSADGWIWFSEKRGKISRYSPESGTLQQVHLIEDVFQSRDNFGLHALALHPEFPTVALVYAHYTYSLKRSRLVRFRFNASAVLLEDSTVLLDNLPANASHNGSRIVFSPQGDSMFLSLGDAFNLEGAQDLNVYSGKILRLNTDGSIPADNPFPDSPIWSYGHRNPQGLVMAGNGKLYSSEHGASDDDELNLIQRGKNYGHPFVRGLCDTNKEVKDCRIHEVHVPMKIWSPTFGVSGIEYYDHEAILEWRNSILVVSMKNFLTEEGKRLQVLKLNEEGDRIVKVNDHLVNVFGRLREVMAAPDGRVFIFTTNREINPNKRRDLKLGDDKLIMLQKVMGSE